MEKCSIPVLRSNRFVEHLQSYIKKGLAFPEKSKALSVQLTLPPASYRRSNCFTFPWKSEAVTELREAQAMQRFLQWFEASICDRLRGKSSM